jgi:cytochrome c-type biogenesis protein CcmH
MVPLLLTGLAGVALGVVIMRLLQTGGAPAPTGDKAAASVETLAGSVPVQPVLANTMLTRFSTTQLALGGAGALMILSAAVFAFRSGDERPGQSSIATAPGAPSVAPGELDDVDTMIDRLATRLKTDTADGEGFRMLGWSYVNTGKSAEAVTAYARAAQLLPNRADVHAGYGEALVAVAKDVVTPEAKAQFDTALKFDPKEPRARFFASLFKAQHDDEKTALEEWIALSNSASTELPWQGDVHQRIEKLAAKLGVSVTGRLKAPATPAALPVVSSPATGGPDAAAIKAASALSDSERTGMIDGMVEGLAAKLQSNPDNVDGWMKLIRSRVVLKDKVRARDDLAMARKAFAASPAKLSQINATATELGL